MKREYASQSCRCDLFTHVIFNSIASTLVARFILDLRGAYYYDDSADQTALTTQFTIHPGGDLAASLGPDSTWVTGQNDDLGSDFGDLDADLRPASALGQPA